MPLPVSRNFSGEHLLMDERNIEERPVDVAIVTNYLDASRGGASRQAVELANCLSDDGFSVLLVSRTPLVMRTGIRKEVEHGFWGAASPSPGASSFARLLAGATRRLSRVARIRAVVENLVLRSFTVAKPPRPGSVFEAVVLAALRISLRPKLRSLRQNLVKSRAPVVVSFITNVNVLAALACWNLPVRLVTSERIPLSSREAGPKWGSYESFTSRRPDVLTANSSRGVGELRARGMRAGQAIALAPNILRSGPSEMAGEALRFIAVGRLVARKRLDLLLRAFKEVADTVSPWRVTIIGDGPERSLLDDLAEELGIAQRVEFLGHVTDVTEVLNAGGIFVHPAESEGTPNALMEAMALGLPCIVAADCEGSVDLISTGNVQSGIVVDVTDSQRLGETLAALSHSESWRHELGTLAQAAARSHSWPNVRPKWISILGLSPRLLPTDEPR